MTLEWIRLMSLPMLDDEDSRTLHYCCRVLTGYLLPGLDPALQTKLGTLPTLLIITPLIDDPGDPTTLCMI